MVAALQQLQTALQAAAGGRGLLAAAGSRLAHSAGGGSSSRGSRGSGPEEEGKRENHGVPASLPEVPPRWRPAPGSHQLSLNSINDPEAWGLTSSGVPQDHQERGTADGYYWLGSSLSNPKESGAPLVRSSPQRSPSTRAPQGFRTAVAHQAEQRKVVFRSSMVEPELPFNFRSSMMDPPLHQPDRS